MDPIQRHRRWWQNLCVLHLRLHFYICTFEWIHGFVFRFLLVDKNRCKAVSHEISHLMHIRAGKNLLKRPKIPAATASFWLTFYVHSMHREQQKKIYIICAYLLISIARVFFASFSLRYFFFALCSVCRWNPVIHHSEWFMKHTKDRANGNGFGPYKMCTISGCQYIWCCEHVFCWHGTKKAQSKLT